MSDKINKTQQKLYNIFEHKTYPMPCQAHRVNNFLEHSCDGNVIVGNLFSNIEHLYVFTLQIIGYRKFFTIIIIYI